MTDPPKRIVVLRAAGANPAGVRAMARWIRAMLPTVLLIIAPAGTTAPETPDDAIALDAQEIESGPLSVADALVRAAATASRQEP